MRKETKEKILKLRIPGLEENWDVLIAEADQKGLSPTIFLEHAVDTIYAAAEERAGQIRLKNAKIEEPFVMATFPFAKQDKLNKRKIITLHDSLDYMTKKQNIILIGPTGVGKTGLATAFLMQAITNGYRGLFVPFPKLINRLYGSIAAHQEERVLRAYANYDCLLIDEIGYVDIEPAQTSLFFRLMTMRHRRKTTIVTTNLGFQEWDSFLKNSSLTAALIDRLIDNSHVINMRSCVGLRSGIVSTDVVIDVKSKS